MTSTRTEGSLGGLGGPSNAAVRVKGMDFLWPFPTKLRPLRFYRARAEIVSRIVGVTSKIWFSMNHVTVHNKEVFLGLHKARQRALITASNHYSNTDDPFIWGMLGWRHVALPLPNNLRYTVAAHDVLYRNPFLVKFFAAGRNVPIVRGDGVYQKGMNYAVDVMKVEKAWVHMFPEGGVNMTQENKRIKWGTARLMMDCDPAPNVLPLWIVGSDEVLNPGKKPYIPKFGKKVTIYFDEKPLEYEEELKEMKEGAMSTRAMRKKLSDKLQERMYELRAIAEDLHHKT